MLQRRANREHCQALQESNRKFISKFDGDAFYAALDSVREGKGMTWRRVAMDAGVSASTFTRLSQGKRPDVDSLTALCAWAGLSADSFMRLPRGDEESKKSNLEDALALFRADPSLGKEQAEALATIVRSAYKGLRKPG